MGLAAGQARLLSITSRKSDCEFQSMRLSHQKIALSRELADLSNEYQNSLDRTKLIYDYYGTGDTTTQLSYGILMTPSVLNDYLPVTLTDTSGRVTLNSKYAAAARAAGIPQEGLGTLPSETMRNAFVTGLCDAGLINSLTADTIKGLPYNQAAGFGGGTTVATITDSGNITDLISYLNENSVETFSIYSHILAENWKNQDGDDQGLTLLIGKDGNIRQEGTYTFSLADLLSDKNQYHLDYNSIKGECSPVLGVIKMQDYLTEPGGFVDWLYEEFSAVLDTGTSAAADALEYAYTETKKLITNPDVDDTRNGHNYAQDRLDFWNGLANLDDPKDIDERTQYGDEDHDDVGIMSSDNTHKIHSKDILNPVGTHIDGSATEENSSSWSSGCHDDNVFRQSHYYVGFLFSGENKDEDHESSASINLNNIAKAFLTFFADKMEGINDIDANGIDKYYVGAGSCVDGVDVNVNRLVTNDFLYQFTWSVGTSVSSDDLGQATFYDALFNQICANGWTENNSIEDPEYLQQMLQSGMLYITKIKEDGYYYQANYSTDSYIKEIADETYIAQAEAKYNTEKAKLNAKEETIDLKMKNLDTEISSLTTEYDTVKNTISKNIEKSFKRYNA